MNNHYLGLFTVESWREFKRHGSTVMGFNENKKIIVSKLKVGDIIICYLTKVSSFVAVMQVTGESYFDTTKIWSDGVFPVRLPVKVTLEVSLTNSTPIRSLAGQLSFLPQAHANTGWTIHVRTSPRLWKATDAKTVISALEAQSAINKDAKNDTYVIKKIHKPRAFMKQPKFKLDTRVGRIIHKSHKINIESIKKLIGSYDKVLSFNKVTGFSVNLPIANTCRPTASCLKTCYFAVGAPSWTNSLKHQYTIYESIINNPLEFAERIAMEYDQMGLSFLRWNGGGDLFHESVQVINYLSKMRPDVILWVVTRIPEFAAQIEQADSVFVHFSLDKSSLARQSQFLKLQPLSQNYFFSYQCEPDEIPLSDNLKNIAVLFFDNYNPSCDVSLLPQEILCPLNGNDNITDTCVKCRRCFNGEAVINAAIAL